MSAEIGNSSIFSGSITKVSLLFNLTIRNGHRVYNVTFCN